MAAKNIYFVIISKTKQNLNLTSRRVKGVKWGGY